MRLRGLIFFFGGNMNEREAIERFKRAGKKEEWYEMCCALWGESREEMLEFRREMRKGIGEEEAELLKRSYTFTARDRFEDYLIAMEWERGKKFYLPRRKGLKRVVEALQRLEDGETDLLCISMPPGTGKALANDTPILTRRGWKRHGDIEVGDEVIGLDGQFKKVLAVRPKCMLDRMVEFTNGEKIVCHENHEWLVHDRGQRKERLLETKTIESRKLDTGKAGRGHRYIFQLPRKAPILGEEKKLGVEPYTFGAWLGDGTNEAPCITDPESDFAIIKSIEKDGYPIRNINIHKTTGVLKVSFDGLRKALHAYGLCYDGRRVEKYIPEEYLTASIEQRLELLAGLLDTDGTLSGQKYVFSTTAEALRDGMVRLISTFGWRASVREQAPHTSSFGIVGKKPVWTVSFSPDMYIPCRLKRKQLKSFAMQRALAIKSITKVEPVEGNCITVEDGMYLAGHTMLPTHNTGLALFYLTWLSGRHPSEAILASSHNTSFLQGSYEECLRELKSDEYRWGEIFEGHGVAGTNAKDLRIDIDKRQRFSTLQFSSIGAGNAGKVRAMRLLYCDDLIEGIEEALSKERLDSKWQKYTVDLRQRKQGNCKELHIATRWSVHDIIGRLEQSHEGDERAEFVKVPALDEKGESNFDYGGNEGFTTKMYEDLRDSMDEYSFRALYMNEPLEREGLLYHPGDLRRYYELPKGEPDAIIAVCDTAEGGGDDTFLPIGYVYGEDHYIEDIVCSNQGPSVTDELCAEALTRNHVQRAQFESNSAGGRTADKVQELVNKRNGSTHITKKRTTANKETKIIVESTWVKQHCLFKDPSVIARGSMYKLAIDKLCSYTQTGRNKHDDVPDGMAQYAQFARGFYLPKVEILDRRRFGL